MSEAPGDKLKRERKQRERIARILKGPRPAKPSEPTPEWVARYGRW